MAGLGDYLETVMGSPLFLGGAALASGEGFGGAMQGMAAGNKFRAEARKRQQEEQMKTFAQQLANDPKSGISPTLAQLFTVAPQYAGQYLIKQPEMELARDKARASIAASNAATAASLGSERRASAMDPLKRQELEARIKAAGQKDALDDYIMGIISGGGQKPAPQSPIQPQSFVPEAGADPNLVLTQAAQPQPTPQGDDPVVDTPAGRMPASRARQLGLALAMRGKGDAGRMIADPAVDQAKLAKEARNKVDAAELDLTEQASRIRGIGRQFKPEYQTYEESIKQAGIGFADKIDFLRSKLPPEVLQKHAEFISYRRDTIDNVNRYIKEITGAAMAIPEAQRIMKGIPNESDGPTAFKAKLDAIERASLMAIARTRYLRENGFKGQPWMGNADDAAKALSIEGFSRIIDQEGDAMARQLRTQNPNAKPEQINGAVKSMLRQKFRLDI